QCRWRRKPRASTNGSVPRSAFAQVRQLRLTRHSGDELSPSSSVGWGLSGSFFAAALAADWRRGGGRLWPGLSSAEPSGTPGLAAVVLVGHAHHAIDHAIVRGVHLLAPDFTADVDAAVAVATLDRTIAPPLGAEHAAIALRHASNRARQRVGPGILSQLDQPA